MKLANLCSCTRICISRAWHVRLLDSLLASTVVLCLMLSSYFGNDHSCKKLACLFTFLFASILLSCLLGFVRSCSLLCFLLSYFLFFVVKYMHATLCLLAWLITLLDILFKSTSLLICLCYSLAFLLVPSCSFGCLVAYLLACTLNFLLVGHLAFHGLLCCLPSCLISINFPAYILLAFSLILLQSASLVSHFLAFLLPCLLTSLLIAFHLLLSGFLIYNL